MSQKAIVQNRIDMTIAQYKDSCPDAFSEVGFCALSKLGEVLDTKERYEEFIMKNNRKTL